MSNYFSDTGWGENEPSQPSVRAEDILGEQVVPDEYNDEPNFDFLGDVEPIEPISEEEEELALTYRPLIEAADDAIETARDHAVSIRKAFMQSIKDLVGEDVIVGAISLDDATGAEDSLQDIMHSVNRASDSFTIELHGEMSTTPASAFSEDPDDDPFTLPQTKQTEKRGPSLF